MSENTVQGVPTRDFTDAGTGESFTAEVEQPFEAGAFENYKAAGLVRAPDAKPAAPKAPRKRTRTKTAA